MFQASEILKSLAWRSIPSKIGDLGKATLSPTMTLGEALSLHNQPINLNGKPYIVGVPQAYRGSFQITAFPASNGKGNTSRQTMQVS
jgi:hypothetical protein